MTTFVVLLGEQTGHNEPLIRLIQLLCEADRDNHLLHKVIAFGPSHIQAHIPSHVPYHNYLPPPVRGMQDVALDLLD